MAAHLRIKSLPGCMPFSAWWQLFFTGDITFSSKCSGMDSHPASAGWARAASAPFPVYGPALEHAADSFDGVRYLGHDGDAGTYAEIAALDVGLGATGPLEETATARAVGADA